MSKRRFNFGQKYLEKSCRVGIAMIRGERYYWITDGYCRWLITDMDPMNKRVKLQVWTS